MAEILSKISPKHKGVLCIPRLLIRKHEIVQ